MERLCIYPKFPLRRMIHDNYYMASNSMSRLNRASLHVEYTVVLNASEQCVEGIVERENIVK